MSVQQNRGVSVLFQDTIAYRQRDEFSNADDYAVYVRENITVGMKVRCCQTYEEVHEGDVGTVVKVSVAVITTYPGKCVIFHSFCDVTG